MRVVEQSEGDSMEDYQLIDLIASVLRQCSIDYRDTDWDSSVQVVADRIMNELDAAGESGLSALFERTFEVHPND